MAAALLTQRARGRVKVASAGSAPGEALNPAVVDVLAELGLDIAGARPTRLTDAMAQHADIIVTMGCGDACPIYPGTRHLDWEVPDPAGLSIEEVRAIRDQIVLRVDALLAELLG